MDFGPKSKVEEGAVVKLDGRFFVIAVSTGKFVCDGNEIMGISTQAPIYAVLEGKSRRRSKQTRLLTSSAQESDNAP